MTTRPDNTVIDPRFVFLNMEELRGLTKKSAPTIYRWIQEGAFPPPIKIGRKSSAWRLSDYEMWADDPEAYQAS